MLQREVISLAYKLLEEHDLRDKGWQFSFFNGKQKLGLCYHHRKMIQFSKHFLMLRDEEILDVLLHEVAHALAGHEAGHGYEWKRVCLRIGARPQASATELSASPESKWTGVCANGHTLKRHMLTEKAKRVACTSCCVTYNNGRYSDLYKFTWHLTEDYQASAVRIQEPVAALTYKPGFEGLTIINFD